MWMRGIEAKNNKGDTALISAGLCGREECVSLLLEKGAI
jgi:ankyrin repeat protein